MSRSILLDTMVFSAVLRKEPIAQQRLAFEVAQNATVLVSPVVYFELRRGLLEKDAQRLLQYLDVIIAPPLWIDVTRGDWETAASLWAKTQRAGHSIEDADLIIAAQANRRDAVVVTDNVRHFRPIADALETWS